MNKHMQRIPSCFGGTYCFLDYLFQPLLCFDSKQKTQETYKKNINCITALYICTFLEIIFITFLTPHYLYAESQDNDYPGIVDPFTDPSNYEFGEDEKEDKEFFHLGRFLMFGLAPGMGIYTGGLGATINPNYFVGGYINYFFDKYISFEFFGGYSDALDQIRFSGGGANIDTQMTVVSIGGRYYFDPESLPKAIALANPFIGLGGGLYIRNQNVLENQFVQGLNSNTTTSFGAYGTVGFEFNIYLRHIYLGLQARYNLVFFPDENQTYGNTLAPGSRAGDYFTPLFSLAYNF